MNVMNISTFARSQEKTEEWLNTIQHHMHLKDEQEAFVVLRAVLHTLRDRLTVNQAIDFGAQLPLLLGGVYYDGWTARDKPVKMKTREDFFSKIGEELPQHINPQKAAVGIFDVIQEKVTAGEVNDIKAELPDEIASLWDGHGRGTSAEKQKAQTKM